MRATVCIPTYNELENLERMVTALAGVLDTDRDRVLVVDDGSPDGTGQVADRLAAELPWVHVLHRERKEGIGRAYLAAFEHVLPEQPKLRPRDGLRLLTRPARRPAADRSLRGRRRSRARVPLRRRRRDAQLEPPPPRRSRAAAALYAQALLGVGVRDLTGGFKCFRRTVLESIDLGAVTTNGYAFQIELTYRALRKGFRVQEIPITFVDREVGGSKMSRAIVVEAAWKVPALRLRALSGGL